MEEGSWMGIWSTKGGNRILAGIKFEYPDNSRVEGVNPRILTVPPRVSVNTGGPPGVCSGAQPCMGRVMREIVVPSPRHFSTQFSRSLLSSLPLVPAPPPLLRSLSLLSHALAFTAPASITDPGHVHLGLYPAYWGARGSAPKQMWWEMSALRCSERCRAP